MTTEAYLSAQSLSADSRKRNTVLSPLIEFDGDVEAEDEDEIPEFPEFELDESGDKERPFLMREKAFITEGDNDGSDTDTQVFETSSLPDGTYDNESDIYMSDDDSSIESKDEDYETDLEVDEAKWLNPERDEHDLTGKTKYMRACTDLGIIPVSYFVKHIQDKELKMKFHGLAPAGIKAISIPLETNTTIEILNLEGNGIDPNGAVCLCKVLRDNYFITQLVLSENRLGVDGGKAVCKLLKGNRNLEKIDLTGNDIGDAVAIDFHHALIDNNTLKTLLLGNNTFAAGGAKWFKEVLAENSTLEVLDLSWNHFGTRGAISLAEGLQENVGLKAINLSMIGLGKPGSEAIGGALKLNRSLLELDISLNRINLQGAVAIASGLAENETLQMLKVGSNPFDADGAMILLQAVDENDGSALCSIDLSKIMVKQNFALLEENIQGRRNFKTINEGVLPDTQVKSVEVTQMGGFQSAPVEVFKMIATHAGVQLEDLLDAEDMAMTVEEFKYIVQHSPIEITEEQLDILVNKLQNNGIVDYSCLIDEESIDNPFEQSVDRTEDTLTETSPVLGASMARPITS
ncbi:hypothetical protein ScPMuIL_013642 [Solemya velum]